MHNIMIFGAGKIGSILSIMLSNSTEYNIFLLDTNFKLFNKMVNDNFTNITLVQQDILNISEIKKNIHENNISALISTLPFYLTLNVAEIAKEVGAHYFDLTEDVATTDKLYALAKDAEHAFVPQCGLAPGVVGIIANHLVKKFDEVHDVQLRVGALPQYTNNKLKYSLTWSTDGLINEYIKPCVAIKNGSLSTSDPLDSLETLIIDGAEYEAFNTSGGLGSLAKLNVGKVHNLNYKSIRYKGHLDEINKLIDKYEAKKDPKKLKIYLESVIPTTYQDIVIIYVSVVGYIDGTLKEEIFTTKILPSKVNNINARAIQVATSAGICGAIHTVLQDESYKGFVYQETLSFPSLLNSEFGKCFNNN